MSSKPHFLALKGRLININALSNADFTTEGCTLYYSPGHKSRFELLDADECKKFFKLLIQMDAIHNPDFSTSR